MIYVVATTKVKPEAREDFIKGSKECTAATQQEKGCIFYDSHTSINDPNTFECTLRHVVPSTARFVGTTVLIAMVRRLIQPPDIARDSPQQSHAKHES